MASSAVFLSVFTFSQEKPDSLQVFPSHEHWVFHQNLHGCCFLKSFIRNSQKCSRMTSWDHICNYHFWTFEESFRRRMELVTAVLLLATLSAISSCFRWNSSIRRLYAIASSIGFRSSRWMFSIKEISTISWSVNSLQQQELPWALPSWQLSSGVRLQWSQNNPSYRIPTTAEEHRTV